MAKIKSGGSVHWFVGKRKRPFAHSTVAESDSIAIALETYGDLRNIPRDLLLNENEWKIIDTYIEAGEYTPPLVYGSKTINKAKK